MEMLKFVNESMLILIPAIWFLGWMLKKSEKIIDWKIPFILTGVGIAGALLYSGFVLEAGFTAQAVTESVVQGILATGVAVLFNEGVKQVTIKRPIDEAKVE